MKAKTGKVKSIKYMWLIGFLGFWGFSYFKTGDPKTLFWFSYFGFFAFYFIGKMADEMQDERYFENSRKAKLKIANIPLIVLFIVGFFSGYSFFTKELIVLICSLGWAVTLMLYTFLFWYYDKH